MAQNLGYYLVAALMIPLGIGHLKLRYWALTLSRLYAWFWLGAGVLVFGHFLWIFPRLIRLEQAQGLQPVQIGIFLLVILVLLPILALIFYYNQGVCEAFEANDSNRYWTERFPFPILALVLIFSIMIIVLHLVIFLQNLFPYFGRISLGRPNVYVIALCVLILGILIYGTVRLSKWAWWGSLVFLSLLATSSVLSFSRYRFYDIILMMNLPDFEMAIVDNVKVLHDLSLAGLVTIPLLIALGLLFYSKRYFWKADRFVETGT
jgi:hypothetical protein